jgi:mono/diheme cytochrome c family protein
MARSRRSLTVAALVSGALLLLGLGGCQVSRNHEDMVTGKQLFVSKCGTCHVLNRAGSKGVTGPNLDQAFARANQDGLRRSTFEGVVERQILYPNRAGVMPAKIVTGQDARDVAAYVAHAVARPGKDTGALANAVSTIKRVALAVEKAGKLEIDAFPDGQLKFVPKAAVGTAGPLTLTSQNKSSTPHNISIEGPGANAKGNIVQGGGISTVQATLRPGKYTFYCSVPGHRQAGMFGTLTVK